MFSNILRILGGDPNKRELERYTRQVAEINALENAYEDLSAEQLRAKTDEFRQRLEAGESLDDLLVEAFAAVREASKRTIGLRHYDVQMIGGMVLHEGKIAEMRTGEGKTLVATLPVYLNALTGQGVHVVTVNDYLARRDARWMAPVYDALGMSVGVLQMAARTQNGRNAFLVDLKIKSDREDADRLALVLRKRAYQADIVYGTNSEFGFDYLRDNLVMRRVDRVQRDHYYAIIDEVDNILIDEARTPLIISGAGREGAGWYVLMARVVRALQPEDYEMSEKEHYVALTDEGRLHAEELISREMEKAESEFPDAFKEVNENPPEYWLGDPEQPEEINDAQAQTMGYLEQALRARFFYRKDKEYMLQRGQVIIVDEFTGRPMPGRRWSEGIHQAVEAKEGVQVQPENMTQATITLQNYFRMYDKICGMTGTAMTESEEFFKIYKLNVFPIPTNLEYAAALAESDFVSVEDRDDEGYKYTFYARKTDQRSPVYWKRKDYPDVVYRTNEAKLRAITQEVLTFHVIGRPQLVGTTSVDHSEVLSERLTANNVTRLMQVLLIRLVWMEKNKADFIPTNNAELAVLYRPLTELDERDLRPLARSLGISMNPADPDNLKRLLAFLRIPEDKAPRLVAAIQGGVKHRVLNARKHDEESMVIAHAGAFGAVTIATNMAGRGVDIKLGGELDEQIQTDVLHYLKGLVDNPYDLDNEERRQLILNAPDQDYGIYEESVKAFLTYMHEMEQVRALGGLHVVGSERHEARRIDNQLRGRAARQGDPGSSRFYLSLEDDLMRLFGGAQVETMWKRIVSDDTMPMEMGLLGRVVEQSQGRVEGNNFDIRKHTLEYDDVLNSQRQRIYAQRDMVFEKEDLTEDALEMLRQDLRLRIHKALGSPDGTRAVLRMLEEIQPPLMLSSDLFPSFSLRLLIDELNQAMAGRQDIDSLKSVLQDLAIRAVNSQNQHLGELVQEKIDTTEQSVDNRARERLELLDVMLQDVRDMEEAIAPMEFVRSLSEQLQISLKVTQEQARQLMQGNREQVNMVHQLVRDQVKTNRLAGLFHYIKKLVSENFALRPSDMLALGWDEIARQVHDEVGRLLEAREQRMKLENDQILQNIHSDMRAALRTDGGNIEDRQWASFMVALQRGTAIGFKNHQRGRRQVIRLKYEYLSEELLGGLEADEIYDRAYQHLIDGLEQMRRDMGEGDFNGLAVREASMALIADEGRRGRLARALGQERYEELASTPVGQLDPADQAVIKRELGLFLSNEHLRRVLLIAISNNWMDHLTAMEALRVSIGMESYAQRDPLVQYKSKAPEAFAQLLEKVREDFVGGMFKPQRYLTRENLLALRRSADGTGEPETPEAAAEARVENQQAVAANPGAQSTAGQQSQPGGGSGRKRHGKRR